MRKQYESIPLPYCQHSGQLARWVCVSPGCTKIPFVCRNCQQDKCMSQHQHGGDVRLRNWETIMDSIQKAKQPQQEQMMRESEGSYQSLVKRLEQLFSQFSQKITHLHKVSKEYEKLKLLEDLNSRQYKEITGEKMRSMIVQNNKIEDEQIKEECRSFVELMREMTETLENQLKRSENCRKSQELRKSATTLIKQQKFVQADDLLNKAIQSHPENIDNLQLRVNLNLKLQRYQQAFRDLQDIIKVNPTYHRAFYLKGLILLRRNQFQNACQCFTIAIKNCKQPPANYNEKRANCLYEMQKYENALTDYSDVLMKRQTPWDYLNRSAVLSKLNLKGASEKDCQMAFKMMEEGEYYEVEPFQSYAFNRLEGNAPRIDKRILID